MTPCLPKSIWVILINFVQLLHNSISGYVSWNNLIQNFNRNAPKVAEAYWVPGALSFLESFSGYLTVTWFAYRLWLFLGPRWKWLAIPVLASATTVMGLGLVIAVEDSKPVSKQLKSYVNSNQNNIHVPWVAGNLLTDLLIAVPMTIKLRSQKSGFRQTDSILSSLSYYIVGTSLLTSTLSLLTLITLLALPNSIAWVAIIRVLSSVYANTLLAFLNRRQLWHERSQNSHGDIHWSENTFHSKGVSTGMSGNGGISFTQDTGNTRLSSLPNPFTNGRKTRNRTSAFPASAQYGDEPHFEFGSPSSSSDATTMVDDNSQYRFGSPDPRRKGKSVDRSPDMAENRFSPDSRMTATILEEDVDSSANMTPSRSNTSRRKPVPSMDAETLAAAMGMGSTPSSSAGPSSSPASSARSSTDGSMSLHTTRSKLSDRQRMPHGYEYCEEDYARAV